MSNLRWKFFGQLTSNDLKCIRTLLEIGRDSTNIKDFSLAAKQEIELHQHQVAPFFELCQEFLASASIVVRDAFETNTSKFISRMCFYLLTEVYCLFKHLNQY
jgi:hypothetical protein